MKFRWIALIAVFVYFVESTLLQNIRISGVMPDLSLITIVLLTMMYDDQTGYACALISGFLRDVVFSHVFGVNIFIFLIVVRILSRLGKTFFEDNYFTSFILTFAVTLLYNVLFFMINYVLDYKFNMDMMMEILLIQPIFNGILAYLMYRVFYRTPKQHHLE